MIKFSFQKRYRSSQIGISRNRAHLYKFPTGSLDLCHEIKIFFILSYVPLLIGDHITVGNIEVSGGNCERETDRVAGQFLNFLARKSEDQRLVGRGVSGAIKVSILAEKTSVGLQSHRKDLQLFRRQDRSRQSRYSVG